MGGRLEDVRVHGGEKLSVLVKKIVLQVFLRTFCDNTTGIVHIATRGEDNECAVVASQLYRRVYVSFMKQGMVHLKVWFTCRVLNTEYLLIYQLQRSEMEGIAHSTC